MELSIIIPIYNAQTYLKQCLETIMACPSYKMECILVNDGSSDQTLVICEEYASKDSRFHVIDKINEGVSVARNTGVLYASGYYVFFLDADDYIDIKKWNVVLKAVEEKQYDLIAFSYYTLLENGMEKEELFPITGEETSDVQVVRTLLLASASLNTCWGKLMRRDVITENALEFKNGVKTGEDAFFVIDYIQKAFSFSIRNESILFYRQHGTSVMHRIDMNEKLEDFKAIYNYRRKLVKHYKDIELEKEMYRQFFSVLTNLFLDYATGNSFGKAKKAYREAVKKTMVQEMIIGTPYERLTPIYKKIEYQLIKRRMFHWLTLYLKLKNRFRQ